MTESGHEKIARRLRELAERFEQGRMRPGAAARIFAMLGELEKLLAAPHASGDTAASGGAAAGDGAAPKGSAAPSTPREPGAIHIWSDGSCAPNPGPGGWAAIVEINGHRDELSGGSRQSTNNIMEMTGALEGLRHTPPGSTVVLTTDSEYLVKGMTQWLAGWKKRGWQTASKEPVKNKELWQQLDALNAERKVRWTWVEGHAGHPENERADVLANEARARL